MTTTNRTERDTMTEKKTRPDEAQDGEDKRKTTLPPKIIRDWAPRTIRLGQGKPEDENPSSAGRTQGRSVSNRIP